MSDLLLPKPPGRAGGRSKRADRATLAAGDGVRATRATLAAAALLVGESEALTRKAVEMALGGDPWTFSPRA